MFINEILGRLDDLDVTIGGIQTQLPNLLTQAEMKPLAANNIDGMPELILTNNNPPTSAEMNQLLNQLNDAINGLHR